MACDPDRIHAGCLDFPASKGDRDSGVGAGKTLVGSPELGPRPVQNRPPTTLLPQPPGFEWLWQEGKLAPKRCSPFSPRGPSPSLSPPSPCPLYRDQQDEASLSTSHLGHPSAPRLQPDFPLPIPAQRP